MKETKRYPLERSPLYNLRRKSKLAVLLNTSIHELQSINPLTQYYAFQLPKPDGSRRDVKAPNDKLKSTQKRLLKLLKRIDTPEWLISGTRKKCYIDNARFHAGANYVLTIDIRKFYDNCIHKHVFSLFRDVFMTSPDVAHILSQITTLSWVLPTGAPTSQLIAFLAYRSTFFHLFELAERYHCKFSLYVDDMAFSSIEAINKAELLEEIAKTLHSVGHRMKYSKIKLYGEGQAKLITGTVLDGENTLRVPNRLSASIMRNLAELKHSEQDECLRLRLSSRLLGRVRAARCIEPGIFPEVYKFATEQNLRCKK